jgi:enoyl-CoA hydratase/carnithine racemase
LGAVSLSLFGLFIFAPTIEKPPAGRRRHLVKRRSDMSLVDFIPTPKFEEYKERFKQHYKMERSKDGVIVVEAHTAGGPIQLSVENHRSVGQLFKTIGADPENEVMIFTGSGEDFMMDADPEGFKLEQDDLQHWAYEYAYKDGRINVSSLVNDLEIPTIGVLNGPGFHTEICLMCDISICSEDAVIFDLHYDIGSVPGDGIHSCFMELLGTKRGAYALLTGQAIDAKKALEYGLVNEVVPRNRLLDRAKQLAAHIMTQPRITRRLTTQIIRRPWKKRITDDLDGGFGIQMFAHLAKKKSIHSRNHIATSVAYVKEGKENNIK